MSVWKRVPNEKFPIAAAPEVEHAEFGRSMADVFPDPEQGKWDIAIDGEIIGVASDLEAAEEEAEIDAWNSERNTLYARRTR